MIRREIIGTLLTNQKAWDMVGDKLNRGMFSGLHRRIFDEIQKQASAGSFDAITVADAFSSMDTRGEILAIGAGVRGTAALEQKVERLTQQWDKQRLQAAANQILEAESLEDAYAILNGIEHDDPSKASSLADLLPAYMDYIGDGSKQQGLQTGLVSVDEKLGGMRGGDLIVIGARPAMGKTAAMLNIALTAAESVPVLIQSLEMPNSQLIARMTASGGVDFGRLRNAANMTDGDWAEHTRRTCKLSKMPIYVDDQAGLSIEEIALRAKREKRIHNIGILFVDYLQLLSSKGRHNNRNDEIGAVSRGLKKIAKDLDIPVVALCQLNRNLETRSDKRPMMADLRESGQIEQDTDVIIFLHRPEVYKNDPEWRGIAEWIIAKHRNGETGSEYVSWQGQYQRFTNLSNFSPPAAFVTPPAPKYAA